ncbi:hypothetical protein M8542_33665 [Amycolatopsis sp. OK19-0408]|uniref:Uncharacterized protein n=1 Tax=Amycolatopsis iheyensis TaxID=2945988 RepID=A0A9X2NMU6_9PSEU|nr:hypothetical protein [Amycolatopsis iheyensis]MCR6487785.1 hypothetical protein [Amycolatopsis iheyensis]
MTDLDELRRALRAEEALAPDPESALAAATRRIRRRRATSVAAVTLSVAALGAGAVGLLDRGAAVTPPASPAGSTSAVSTAPGGKVPPAAPAVSLQDSSWHLLVWSVEPHYVNLHYGQDRKYGLELAVREGTAPATALPAKPTSAAQIPDTRSVMWQDTPDRWFWVRTTKPMKAAELVTLLAKIGTTPPVVDAPLKSVRVPDGQQLVAFTSEPEANTFILCPDLDADRAPLDSRCLSVFVSLSSTAGSSSFPNDPLPVHQHREIGRYTVEIDSSSANEQAARQLMNSVTLTR